jgi:hypothetical protein
MRRRLGRILLDVLCAPFPKRVTNEELGDALERVARLSERRRGFAYLMKAAAILAGALCGIAWNSVRELVAAGRRRRRGGSDA